MGYETDYAIASSEAREEDFVNCDRCQASERNPHGVMMKYRNAEQSQPEQNEIERNAEQSQVSRRYCNGAQAHGQYPMADS